MGRVGICGVDPEFVKTPLQFVLDHLHGETSLTTVKHLSAKQVNGIEIPLPPLAEQHRIVAKVDELMALCDRLDAARAEPSVLWMPPGARRFCSRQLGGGGLLPIDRNSWGRMIARTRARLRSSRA
jgi:hypothetical protein